jgi:hypothetical protein
MGRDVTSVILPDRSRHLATTFYGCALPLNTHRDRGTPDQRSPRLIWDGRRLSMSPHPLVQPRCRHHRPGAVWAGPRPTDKMITARCARHWPTGPDRSAALCHARACAPRRLRQIGVPRSPRSGPSRCRRTPRATGGQESTLTRIERTRSRASIPGLTHGYCPRSASGKTSSKIGRWP